MLSKFLKKTICTKLVIPVGNKHLCFWCNAAEFTKKNQSPRSSGKRPSKDKFDIFLRIPWR